MSNLQWQRGIERIALTSTGVGKRIVGLTSASPAAGVSLVCHHLARTIAASDLKTLRVDAGGSRDRPPGEAGWRPGTTRAAEFIRPAAGGYDLLRVGSAGDGPNSSCNPGMLRDVFAAELAGYARIVVEMPSLLDPGDAGVNPLAIAGVCDQLLFVCAVGRDRASEIGEALALLAGVGVEVSGMVTNEHMPANAADDAAGRLSRFIPEFLAKPRWRDWVGRGQARPEV